MTDASESIDLDERRNWAERCIEMGRLRDAVTIGPVEMLAILDRLRKAEARIEKVRKFVAPDMSYGPLEDDWERGNKNAFDAIYDALTEGDEQ
ncbi:hypothetical protein [Paramicrobacterium agarici]|uniref:hypothetical protein n=1 Tax=Paramicrobacterium agarici TaxID=630514 RepID=UPI00115337BF|nr:hypothetical protein [Microbacterium agarici]TQO23808.1 hypothetical protein FB385_2670 [Microbacterium agarici]